MPAASQRHVSGMSAACQHACQRHVNGMPAACQRHVNDMPMACQRHTNGMPAAYQRYANAHANGIPSACQRDMSCHDMSRLPSAAFTFNCLELVLFPVCNFWFHVQGAIPTCGPVKRLYLECTDQVDNNSALGVSH